MLVFDGSFKGVSRKFKEVSRMFQESLKGVPRYVCECQGYLKELRGVSLYSVTHLESQRSKERGKKTHA